MSVYVGLDGGGSSCRALAIDADGKPLFRGQSGSANLLSTPPDLLERNVLRALEGCPDPTSVFGCFAGLLTSKEHERVLAMLRLRFSKAALGAGADYLAPLQLAEPCDALVIAGTGSIIVSRIEGRVVKSGGGGYLLGDRGSAFQVGRATVLRYLEAGSESLGAVVQGWCGSREESAIIAALYSAPSPAQKLGELAGGLAALAHGGDEESIHIIHTELGALAAQVVEHLERVNVDGAPTLVLAGGLWNASAYFPSAFESALRMRFASDGLIIRKLKAAPVEGAALLAKEMAS